jgi:hypothetical protein
MKAASTQAQFPAIVRNVRMGASGSLYLPLPHSIKAPSAHRELSLSRNIPSVVLFPACSGRAALPLLAQVSVDYGFRKGLEILGVFDGQGADFIKLFPFLRGEVPITGSQIFLKLG